MVEHIPWNYKWEASEGALPDWLQERGNNNTAVAEADRKWMFEDGLLVHKTSDGNKLKFVGPVYENGFIFEAEINLDEQLWTSSSQAGFICWTGTALHNGNFIVFRPRPTEGKLYLHATNWTALATTPLPTGFFKVRGGYDATTKTYFAQAEGARRDIVSEATQYWSFMCWQLRYVSATGKSYLKSLKVYTY